MRVGGAFLHRAERGRVTPPRGDAEKPIRAAVLVWALLVPSLALGQAPRHASAQGSAFQVPRLDQPSTSTTPPGASREHFLALDVFVGAVGSQESDQTGDEWPTRWGWDTGATVVFPVRWFGVTGAFGRHVSDEVSIHQFVVGPQYQSKWYGSDMRGRYFLEFLIGVARSTGVARPQSNLAWIYGFGFDFYFVRVKFEWVGMNTNGLQPRNVRLFVGGVLPICLRACEDSDLILSGR